MDELKEPPRNELAYWLSQKLRSVNPSAVGRASPVLGALGGFVKGAVTDPVARGLESWAYGDRAFGPSANAPLVNERTMEMASALPLGLGAKGAMATAQLVPARPLLNADALAASRLAKRIREADDAVVEGANARDIWEFFGLQRAPGLVHPRQTGKIADKLHQTRWLEELNPENKIVKGFDPARVGEYPVDKVFDSPELFRQYPELRNITLEVTPSQFSDKSLGEFQYLKNKGYGKIVIPSNSPDFQGTAAHELSHGVMHNLGQVSSYGYGGGNVNELMHGAIGDVGAYLESLPGSAQALGKVPEQLYRMSTAPNGRTSLRNGLWDLSSGETLAETSRLRSGADSLSDLMRKARAPEEDFPVANPLNDYLVERAAKISRTGAPIDQQAQSLVRLLRENGVVPQ